MKAGLIHFNEEEEEHTKAIIQATQNHQEKTLGLTNHDFPRVCPQRKVLNKIWHISLQTEKFLFPSLFEDSKADAEANLREDFDLAAKTSLCVLDVQKVLQDDAWKTFFKSMKV